VGHPHPAGQPDLAGDPYMLAVFLGWASRMLEAELAIWA
jgi:hypothetical protein